MILNYSHQHIVSPRSLVINIFLTIISFCAFWPPSDLIVSGLPTLDMSWTTPLLKKKKNSEPDLRLRNPSMDHSGASELFEDTSGAVAGPRVG